MIFCLRNNARFVTMDASVLNIVIGYQAVKFVSSNYQQTFTTVFGFVFCLEKYKCIKTTKRIC